MCVRTWGECLYSFSTFPRWSSLITAHHIPAHVSVYRMSSFCSVRTRLPSNLWQIDVDRKWSTHFFLSLSLSSFLHREQTLSSHRNLHLWSARKKIHREGFFSVGFVHREKTLDHCLITASSLKIVFYTMSQCLSGTNAKTHMKIVEHTFSMTMDSHSRTHTQQQPRALNFDSGKAIAVTMFIAWRL